MWRLAIRIGPLLVLVSAAATYWSAERARVDASDDDLAIAADRVAAAVDVYLARVVNDLAMIANSPDIRAEAARHSARPRDLSYEERLDREWQSPNEDTEGLEHHVRAILSTTSSAYLRSMVRLEGMVTREIAVADHEGRLIAASVRTDDYLQGDDDWWPVNRQAFLNCRVTVECAAFPRPLRWDETAAAWGMDVVLPVFGPTSEGSLAGFLKVVIAPMQELGPLTADALDVRIVTKDTGRPLLTPNDTLDLTKTDIERLHGLGRGHQAIFRPGRVVTVRVLSNPLGKYWAVAATRPVVPQTATWVVPTAWLGLTVAALLLAMSSRPPTTRSAVDAVSSPVRTV